MAPTRRDPAPPSRTQSQGRDGGGVDSLLIAGRYRLTGLLGRGGMADVYAAHDERLDRPVAVKLFRPGTGMPHQETRAQGEIKLLARLNHPNLVTVLDAGTAPPDPPEFPVERTYLVMEFVDGRTLAHEIEQHPLSPSVAAQIGSQIADALSYIHTAGIVHRDVKPANILIGDAAHYPEGKVNAKLSDFGIARMLDDTRLTVDGTVGTANYLSPEQATGAEVGPASDVYSLALVLLEALTGQIVYAGSGVAAVAARLYRDPDIPAAVPSAWATLLRQMLERDPARRPTAAQVGARMRDLSGMPRDDMATGATMPLNNPPDGALPPTLHAPSALGHHTGGERKPRRRYLWIAAGGGFIVLVALIATLIALNNPGGRPSSALAPTRSEVTHHATTRHARPSSPTPTSNAPTAAHRPANAAQAITALRAAIAHAVSSGNLDIDAASDLDHKLADISKTITKSEPKPGKGPAPAPKPSDAGHKMNDFVKHLDDLSKAGQLTGAGRRQLSAALAALEHFIPPQQ